MVNIAIVYQKERRLQRDAIKKVISTFGLDADIDFISDDKITDLWEKVDKYNGLLSMGAVKQMNLKGRIQHDIRDVDAEKINEKLPKIKNLKPHNEVSEILLFVNDLAEEKQKKESSEKQKPGGIHEIISTLNLPPKDGITVGIVEDNPLILEGGIIRILEKWNGVDYGVISTPPYDPADLITFDCVLLDQVLKGDNKGSDLKEKLDRLGYTKPIGCISSKSSVEGFERHFKWKGDVGCSQEKAEKFVNWFNSLLSS